MTRYILHEWLSGGVSPCQGEGRGFESRLVLLKTPEIVSGVFFVQYARGADIPWRFYAKGFPVAFAETKRGSAVLLPVDRAPSLQVNLLFCTSPTQAVEMD